MYEISFIEPSLLPRERLVSEGVEKLSHQELVSILLRTGNKQKSVYEIAQNLLTSVNSLKELGIDLRRIAENLRNRSCQGD